MNDKRRERVGKEGERRDGGVSEGRKRRKGEKKRKVWKNY